MAVEEVDSKRDALQWLVLLTLHFGLKEKDIQAKDLAIEIVTKMHRIGNEERVPWRV